MLFIIPSICSTCPIKAAEANCPNTPPPMQSPLFSRNEHGGGEHWRQASSELDISCCSLSLFPSRLLLLRTSNFEDSRLKSYLKQETPSLHEQTHITPQHHGHLLHHRFVIPSHCPSCHFPPRQLLWRIIKLPIS